MIGLDDNDGWLDFNGEEDITSVGSIVGMKVGTVVGLKEGYKVGLVGMIVG